MTQEAPPDAITAELKRSQAIELRISGANYREIARVLGIGVATAHLYVTKGLEELRDANIDKTEEYKKIELTRLDSIQAALWSNRKDPNTARAIIKCMERRHRLLGLDAPLKWEGVVTPGSGGQTEVDLDKLSLDDLRQLEGILARGSSVALDPAGPIAVVSPPIASIPAETNGASANGNGNGTGPSSNGHHP